MRNYGFGQFISQVSISTEGSFLLPFVCDRIMGHLVFLSTYIMQNTEEIVEEQV